MLSWNTFKAEIVHNVGMTEDLLHVYIGMMIYVATSLMTYRSPRRWLWAFLMVCGVESANELFGAIDALIDLTPPDIMDVFLDIVHTLLWPLVLTIVIRLGSRSARPSADP